MLQSKHMNCGATRCGAHAERRERFHIKGKIKSQKSSSNTESFLLQKSKEMVNMEFRMILAPSLASWRHTIKICWTDKQKGLAHLLQQGDLLVRCRLLLNSSFCFGWWVYGGLLRCWNCVTRWWVIGSPAWTNSEKCHKSMIMIYPGPCTWGSKRK